MKSVHVKKAAARQPDPSFPDQGTPFVNQCASVCVLFSRPMCSPEAQCPALMQQAGLQGSARQGKGGACGETVWQMSCTQNICSQNPGRNATDGNWKIWMTSKTTFGTICVEAEAEVFAAALR